MSLPTFPLHLSEAVTFPVDLARFGRQTAASGVIVDEKLPEKVRQLCMVYEEILRRLFRECVVFNPRVSVKDDLIQLNSIDVFSSRLVLDFLRNPLNDRYLNLYRILRRRYCVRPDVMTLIVCRNLGIRARRLASDTECEEYWQWLSECPTEFEMPGAKATQLSWMVTKAQFVVLELARPVVFLSQTSPFTSTTMLTLLKDKSLAAELLRSLGFHVPLQVLLRSEQDLASTRALKEVILKPSNGSNRLGVIGPIETTRLDRLRDCHCRCVAQAKGSSLVIAEQFIRGTPYRINVNHGKVTFVAKSIRNEVVGDGRSSIRQLLAARRREMGWLVWFPDELIENTIVGAGLRLDSVIDKGRRLALSHDGNEEGAFVDVGEEFPDRFKKEALAIAEQLRCPVLGIDGIVDEDNELWIVDVNADAPAVAFFTDPRRAYETMEHMIRQTLIHERESCDIPLVSFSAERPAPDSSSELPKFHTV